MKKGQVIALACSFFLVLALVLSACGQEATPTTPTTPTTPATPTTPTTPAAPQVVEKVVQPTYKVLNPAGSRTPVECKALAERLTTLDGKKILYYETEGARNFMPLLLETLRKDYPKTTFDLIYFDNFGSATPTDEQKTYDGYIRGVSW